MAAVCNQPNGWPAHVVEACCWTANQLATYNAGTPMPALASPASCSIVPSAHGQPPRVGACAAASCGSVGQWLLKVGYGNHV